MLIHAIKALLSNRQRAWRHNLTSLAIQWHWPELRINGPCAWTVDDLNSLDLTGRIQIGAFTEIVVEAKSPYSRVAGSLRIGDCTVIGSSCNIRAGGGAISIGRDCLIGQHVSLIGSNHQIKSGKVYWQQGWDETETGVSIGDNVWVGCGVTVLPGVKIGNNAVVGANSVVTKSIPESTIWVGNPARQVRAIK